MKKTLFKKNDSGENVTSETKKNQITDKCQRFTPNTVVQKMLKIAGYESQNDIIGKKVLENSFGKGDILIAIVSEYIKACKQKHFSEQTISQHLSSNIYGIELDKDLFRQTKRKLNKLTDNNNIPRVKWKLFNVDALFWKRNISFDYIIGNPPYIAYSEIDTTIREKIRKNYSSCSLGKFDYCYAFIESALNYLSPKGRLIQLIPNSIYKNVFAEELRKMLRDHISQIHLFPNQQLFKDTLTSVSIFKYDKKSHSNYIRCINHTTNTRININREQLHGKWVFSKNDNKKGDTYFKELFKTSSAIATLLNRAFVLTKETAEQIESDVIRPAASPKSMHYKKKEYIIFPYHYDEDNLLCEYTEEEFQKRFPRAEAHLKQFKSLLKSRASDKSAKWFEYGRSQALQHINQEKLILSTVVTNTVLVYCLDKETVPYTGMYIIPVNNTVDLTDAKAILESDDFLDYVQKIGISVSGMSMRITCKDVDNYCFNKEDLQIE